MENNKSCGNDGHSKQFYECFWDEIKKTFQPIYKAFLNKELIHQVSVLPSYRNQSIDLLCESIDLFLYKGNTGT